MSRIVCVLLLALIVRGNPLHGQTKLNASVLIKLAESGNLAAFSKFARSMNYIVLDSSKGKESSIIYITKEIRQDGNLLDGNILGCTTDNKLKIGQLHFTTYSKQTYDDFKKQLKTLGFKSSGLKKRNVDGTIETEDFESSSSYVATSAAVKNDKAEFEFIFFKF